MKSYNNVTLVGRSVKDCEYKELGEASQKEGIRTTSRAMFCLAVDRPYKDSDGKHPVDFLNIVAWGKLAEICRDYVKKSNLILVSGRIQSRSYEVNNETKWITEIVADSINILETDAYKGGK